MSTALVPGFFATAIGDCRQVHAGGVETLLGRRGPGPEPHV